MSARIAALVLVALSLAGCATSEDDRAFFNEGWVRPEAGSEKRINHSGW